jgi:hypothetical protein
MPGGNSKWHTSLVSVVPSGINTRQNPMKRSLPDERPAPTKPTPAQKKRKGMKTRFQSVDKQSEKKDGGEKEVLAANKTSVDIKPNPAARAIASQSWWESPEAHALFSDVKRSKGDNGDSLFPREYVEARTERLKKGHTTAHGWKTVLDDFDANDICTPSDIFNIQMKCKYVSLALRIATEDMPGSKWMECCERAVARQRMFSRRARECMVA